MAVEDVEGVDGHYGRVGRGADWFGVERWRRRLWSLFRVETFYGELVDFGLVCRRRVQTCNGGL